MTATCAFGVIPDAVAAPDSVLRVATSPMLGCAIVHRDDASLQFFGATAPFPEPDPIDTECGTFLAVADRVFAPALYVPAPDETVALDGPVFEGFTPVSQSPVTGRGTPNRPFRLVTLVEAGDTGVAVQQTDTWTSTGESVTTRIDLFNATGGRVPVVLYRSGDCQDGASASFGRVRPGKVACIAPTQDGAFRDMARPVPGDAIVQFAGVGAVGASDLALFGSLGDTIETTMLAGQPFGGSCERCEPDEAADRSIGLSWSASIPARSSSTFRTTTTLSVGAHRATPRLTASADPAVSERVLVRLETRAALRAGQTIRFLRDGTEVCRTTTDAAGRGICDVGQDLGVADPEVAQLTPSPLVEILFDGSLDLRPAVTIVQVAEPAAAPVTLPPPPCLPVDVSMTVSIAGPSCSTVRYAFLRAGQIVAWLPGDGNGSLSFDVWAGSVGGPVDAFVAVRFRQPDVELYRTTDFIFVGPGKPRR